MQSFTGFQLVQTNSLDGLGLDTTCEQVLYQTINCDDFVLSLGEKVYHHGLNNLTLTTSVCDQGCESSLKTIRRRVAGACAKTPDLTPGYPVLAIVDAVYAGWNETCLKDNTTTNYCNEIIDGWTPVDDVTKMPKDQLCSYCYGAKLRTMQQSPYSAYDQNYEERLKYVIKTCGASQAPTTPNPGGIVINSTLPVLCTSGKTYSTMAGGTCDSIAQANNVSSAALYYINPGLRSCDNIAAGTTVCLPQTCETIYSVKPTDTCVAIGIDQGTSWQNIIAWNAGLDSLCSNIVGAKPSWGSTICVTPPGGGFEGSEGNSTMPGNGNSGGQGGSGDGYADQRVDPPAGATVGQGTTKKCGQYYQAKPGDDCAKTLARETVSMDLFIQVNPSLVSAASCTSKLLTGVYYCLRPLRYWNEA